MSILNQITEKFDEEEFLRADGFDEAIIGVEENSMRLMYSVTKCLEIIEAQGLPYEDALEHFYYNIQGVYVGEKRLYFALMNLTSSINNYRL